MTDVVKLPVTRWDQPCPPELQAQAIDALERGQVLCFPELEFALDADEQRLLSPAIAGQGKNISLDPATGLLRGSSATGAELQRLQAMVQRFADSSRALMRQLLPHYEAGLQQARTSFRPVEIAGRSTSWRKDDTRLHVDAFPSSPTRGTRILRIFSNVNPQGQSRRWRLGEPFEDVARRFLPAIRGPLWGSSALLEMLHVTKGRRSAYDHFMLRLHDTMKADLDYQARVAQSGYEFRPGSSWMVYTDQASHAAMAGQHALEQTYHLPVGAMHDPARSPLRTLERLLARELV